MNQRLNHKHNFYTESQLIPTISI